MPLTAGAQLGDTDAAFEVPWTPIRYGIAETHGEEMFRPPTWHPDAGRDEEGRSLGAGSEESEQDEGALTPVIVRVGEPERNAAHRHLAGVDEQGRDFFSRLIWGSAPA